MIATEYLDRAPAGWFVLAVMRERERGWDWTALMLDVDPDEYRNDWYKMRKAQEAWVRIPGKHKSRAAAWDALEQMLATKH